MIHELRSRHRHLWPLFTIALVALLFLALSQRAPESGDAASYDNVSTDLENHP